VQFPDSSELRHLDDVPTPGARLRSASGREWFVAETLQSGRDTYTVYCVDRRELFEGAESVPARVVVEDLLEDIAKDSARARELADHLLEAVRRSLRGEDLLRTDRAFVASYVGAHDWVFEEVIYAPSIASAESEALERARSWNVTVAGIQPGLEWPSTSPATASRTRERRWLAQLRLRGR
jgi:hypothetical protein